MNSLLYGLALLGVVIVLQWYVQNDGDGQDDGSVGLLAMKSQAPKEVAVAPSRKRSFRRKG